MRAFHAIVAIAMAVLLSVSRAGVAAPRVYSTSPLPIATTDASAILLPDGRVLFAGGNADGQALSFYNPQLPGWQTGTLKLALAYDAPLAVLLKTGQVLIAGGQSKYAEIFDPATNTLPGAPLTMQSSHGRGTATLLPNGKVLIVGGPTTAGGIVPTEAQAQECELFDPDAGAFSLAGSLNTGRAYQSTILLPTGAVLTAGGCSPLAGSNHNVDVCHGLGMSTLNSSETYSLLNDQWTTTATTLPGLIAEATFAMLPSGDAFFLGGDNTSLNSETALFHNGAWQLAGTAGANGDPTGLNQPPYQHAGSVTPNGVPFSVGGLGQQPASMGYEFFSTVIGYGPDAGADQIDYVLAQLTYAGGSCAPNNETGTWMPNGKFLVAGGTVGGSSCGTTNASYMPTSYLIDFETPGNVLPPATYQLVNNRVDFTATALPDGRILLAGGSFAAPDSEILASVNFAATTARMVTERARHAATLLLDGRVLVEGGVDDAGAPLAAAEIFDPSTNGWSPTGPLHTPRADHTATRLPSGLVLVTGGDDNAASGPNAIATSELYDPATASWVTAAPLNVARNNHVAKLLPNGEVVVAGGAQSGAALSSTELYAVEANTWTKVGKLTQPRAAATATLVSRGLLVAGGASALPDNQNELSSAELMDLGTYNWTPLDAGLSVGRAFATETLLPDGKALIMEGNTPSGPSITADLYDPEVGVWDLNPAEMIAPRSHQAAVLLPSGQVAVAGGAAVEPVNIEVFDEGRGAAAVPALTPQVIVVAGDAGLALVLPGTGLIGIGEESAGNSRSSPANYPLMELQEMDSEAQSFAGLLNWSPNGATAVLPSGLPGGWYWIRPVVNGIAGTAIAVEVGQIPAPAPSTNGTTGMAVTSITGAATTASGTTGATTAGSTATSSNTTGATVTTAGDTTGTTAPASSTGGTTAGTTAASSGPSSATSSSGTSTTGSSGASSGGASTAGATSTTGAGTSGGASTGQVESTSATDTTGTTSTSGASQPTTPVAFSCSCGSTGAPSGELVLLGGLLSLARPRRRGRRRNGKRRWGARFFASALALCFAGSARAAPPADKIKIAVLRVQVTVGLDPKLGEVIDDQLAGMIAERPGLQVVSTRDIAQMTGLLRQRALLGCTGDTQCLTEIGGALGAERVVTGSIAKVGKSIAVSFQLFNGRRGTVDGRYVKRLKRAEEEQLLDLLPEAVAAILGDLGNAAPVAPPPSFVAAAPLPASAPVASPPPEIAVTPEAPPPASRPLSLAVRVEGLPQSDAFHGAIVPQVGWRVNNAWTVSAGFIIANPVGILPRVAWVPFAADSIVHPVVALEVPILFTSGSVSVGPGASVGVEWTPMPWLALGAEVPVNYFVVAPAGLQRLWGFGALTTAVRL